MLSVYTFVAIQYLLISTLSLLCTFKVLSVDHSSIFSGDGKYFNFNKDAVSATLGRTFTSGQYLVFNLRTTRSQTVYMWDYANGGSIGDGHGRVDEGGFLSANTGDWQTGDVLMVIQSEVTIINECDDVIHVITPDAFYYDIGDTLAPNKALYEGYALRSENGKYAAAMRHDGKLIVYNLNKDRIVWQTGTSCEDKGGLCGNKRTYAILQAADGNLVTYIPNSDGHDFLIYASYHLLSNGQTASGLKLENDGNLVGYTTNGEPFFAAIELGTINDYECTFNVLTDHSKFGRYFSFDTEIAGNILGEAFQTGYYRVFNSRTRRVRLVRMWEKGTGRVAPFDSKHPDDWKDGDILAFETPSLISDNLQCTDWPTTYSAMDKEEKCMFGNGLNDRYYYVYNEHRGENGAECGSDANCWCCRTVTPQSC